MEFIFVLYKYSAHDSTCWYDANAFIGSVLGLLKLKLLGAELPVWFNMSFMSGRRGCTNMGSKLKNILVFEVFLFYEL